MILRSNVTLCAALSIFLYSTNLSAEDLIPSETKGLPEVIVEGERIPLSVEKNPVSATVLDQRDIKDFQALTVGELLAETPGLNLIQSGGRGGNTATFLRGANSEHTAVFYDGIAVNDPISPTRAFNFANLSAGGIEKIEVLRGPQSSLYGSDAIGGVISITSKKGEGAPSLLLSSEYGSYDSFNEQILFSGAKDTIAYSIFGDRQDTEGFSSATTRNGNDERDAYHATTAGARFDAPLGEFLDSTFTIRKLQSRTELDNSGGAGQDDPNRNLDTEQFFSRGQLATKKTAAGTFIGGVSFSDQSFTDNNFPDAAHPGDLLLSNYSGKTVSADLRDLLEISKTFSVLVGFDAKSERGSSNYLSESQFGPYSDVFDDHTLGSQGGYSELVWESSPGVVTTASGRVDNFDLFDVHETGKLGQTIIVEGTKFFGTYGTGYKAPSLFQLYSQYGNRDLLPEKSTGWDAGVERQFFDRSLKANLTYFHNDFDDLISFNPKTFISENINSASSHGLEGTIDLEFSSRWRGTLGATYLETKDDETGLSLLRRARGQAVSRINFKATDRLSIFAQANAVSARKDLDFSSFPSERTTLAGYATANLGARFEINDKVELFGRVENLLDKNYEEILGFGTPGVTVFAGIRVKAF